MAIDFDAQVHLADLRTKVLRGEQVTPAEYRDLLLDMRRGRDMANAKSKADAAKVRRVKQPSRPKLDLTNLFNGGKNGNSDIP